ncbi:histone-fold-containing protein [Neocallimastix lanati (nom. inval.)]|uniref:Histone-fold-containing protein n=1 Tax=Neocallimastix californiae TaxID=1754190 RepID=A0A1Y2DF82_9FUNG|nr:histone-fold-containing protein [Neocallimastix sp. JGI-2020a]ORY57325.1 histone-fold-containing protein [Neocallimastix californiae]|eukprot:ORY57325.1 histone-fold-containing protein [Neocallimastix californiae]
MVKKRYKTKFPIARIKKIMRLDEEVGKVAQVTPVLISKSLELFMQSLIDETCKETRNRGAKKMSVSHLKRCIMNTEKFDFLKDIVSSIPDPVETMDSAEAGKATSTKGDKESKPKVTRGKKKYV